MSVRAGDRDTEAGPQAEEAGSQPQEGAQAWQSWLSRKTVTEVKGGAGGVAGTQETS